MMAVTSGEITESFPVSFTTALQKPRADVTETTSIFYKIYV